MRFQMIRKVGCGGHAQGQRPTHHRQAAKFNPFSSCIDELFTIRQVQDNLLNGCINPALSLIITLSPR
jgi:hypothetical protein